MYTRASVMKDSQVGARDEAVSRRAEQIITRSDLSTLSSLDTRLAPLLLSCNEPAIFRPQGRTP